MESRDRREQEARRYEEDRRQRSMERTDDRAGQDQSMQRSEGGGGDWYGYVQPYRYYGPGYHGVGYYSVMYQGGDRGGDRGWQDEQGWQQDSQEATGQGSGDRGSWQGGSHQDRGSWQGGQQERSRGRYTGMGPRGYRRSDERIREDVSDRLAEHGDLDASDIEVEVKDGEVTLTGTVESRMAKRLAEDLAESCSGVRDVMNQLKTRGSRDQGWRDRAEQQASQTPSSRSRSRSSGERDREGQGETAPNGRAPVDSRR